jgi:hypothetical protein
VMFAPDNTYEHYWRNGDLLIWDNVACLHSRGSLANVARRTLQRVTSGKQMRSPGVPRRGHRPYLPTHRGVGDHQHLLTRGPALRPVEYVGAAH